MWYFIVWQEWEIEMHLYHLVPPEMVGLTLYPPDELEKRLPEVYRKAMEKYPGREYVPKIPIQELGCTWGKVIHLAGVSPGTLHRTQRRCGLTGARYRQAFEIPVEVLDPELLVVCIPMKGPEGTPQHYWKFRKDDLSHYAEIPPWTEQYYRSCARNGTHPYLFEGVPHIMYRGSIDVTNLLIV